MNWLFWGLVRTVFNTLTVTTLNVVNATISGLLKWADGTVSAPGASFTSDTNCGWYRLAADVWANTTGGVLNIMYSEGNGEVASIFGGNIVTGAAITAVTAGGGAATLAKTGIGTGVSENDFVVIYEGSTAGDYGLYEVVTVAANLLTLDRALAGTDADLAIFIIADAVAIENSTNTGIARILLPVGSVTAPSLALQPGTGLYKYANGTIGFAVGGTIDFALSNNGFRGLLTGYPSILSTVGSATAPNLVSNKDDTNTGRGHIAADIGAEIAGGVLNFAYGEGNGEVYSVHGGNIVETITDASTTNAALTLTKAGENFLTTCSVGDVVLVHGGTFAADYGLYVIAAVTSDTVLTVDRAFGCTGTITDVDFVVIADALTIENSTGTAGLAKLRLGGGGMLVTAPSVTRAIDIQVTPTTADRQLYMDINYVAAKEAAYIIGSSTVTSGSVTAVRARGQGKAAGASTAEITGVHAQGISFASLYSGTVNALYSEAIAKDATTVVTIRGAMIACDSENTPTSITNMYGAHIRIKSSVAPGTAFIGTIIETEKFGGGVIADSLLDLRSSTWAANEEAVVAIIDMSNFAAKASHAHIRFPLAAMDNDSTTEGDFWYDSANHVFKYRDNAGVKTLDAT